METGISLVRVYLMRHASYNGCPLYTAYCITEYYHAMFIYRFISEGMWTDYLQPSLVQPWHAQLSCVRFSTTLGKLLPGSFQVRCSITFKFMIEIQLNQILEMSLYLKDKSDEWRHSKRYCVVATVQSIQISSATCFSCCCWRHAVQTKFDIHMFVVIKCAVVVAVCVLVFILFPLSLP